jgi:hypothetical protein
MASKLENEWPDHPKAGDVAWKDEQGPFVVMGIIDGYYMIRRPGCMPLVMHWRDLRKKRQPEIR